MSDMGPYARVIEDEDALAALAPHWAALWARSPGATPFSHPAWLLPWWRQFRPGRLLCFSVWQGERLAALAPSFLEGGHHGRRLLPLGLGLSDHCDVLLDPDALEAADALGAAVSARSREFDLWMLEALHDGAAAWRLPVPDGAVESVTKQDPCPVLALPAGAADGASAVPSTKRRKLQLARNRAARRGCVTVEQATGATAQELFRTLVALHGARWASRGEAGVLADPAVPTFHADALPGLADAGLLRLLRLRIGGADAAVFYGLADHSAWYGYLTGLDPDYAFESAGTLVVAAAIERAREEGATRFSFLRGGEAYKYGWGARDAVNRCRAFRWP